MYDQKTREEFSGADSRTPVCLTRPAFARTRTPSLQCSRVRPYCTPMCVLFVPRAPLFVSWGAQEIGPLQSFRECAEADHLAEKAGRGTVFARPSIIGPRTARRSQELMAGCS